jgi:hypothetical protein
MCASCNRNSIHALNEFKVCPTLTQSLSVHLKNTSKIAMTISKDRLCDTAPARSVPSGRALSCCLVVWNSNETDATAAYASGISNPISHVQAMWGKRAA